MRFSKFLKGRIAPERIRHGIQAQHHRRDAGASRDLKQLLEKGERGFRFSEARASRSDGFPEAGGGKGVRLNVSRELRGDGVYRRLVLSESGDEKEERSAPVGDIVLMLDRCHFGLRAVQAGTRGRFSGERFDEGELGAVVGGERRKSRG